MAPESQRVDLVVPRFSNPADITNPLFPISNLHSALLVGKLEGKPWRAETTLLPYTRNIDWNGQHVETRQSQFVAYLNGRIFEVAVDHYAQADDGSVWYFGEDAFTYQHGRPVNTEGTWLAGVDGPPAMIMPGNPQVGQVYRTENIPGVVFEQVTVKKVDQTVMGPTGPVGGVMIAQELHMDETRLEDKTFAPGYGEWFSGSGKTFEANALAVPADAVSELVPAGLVTISNDAISVFDAARSRGWSAASSSVDGMKAAWAAVAAGNVPKRLATEMSGALGVLGHALGKRDPIAAPVAALQVAQAGLDLQLQYSPSVDASRFDLWTRRLQVDAGAGYRANVIGDVATLEWIRDRIALNGVGAGSIDDQIRVLEAAAESGEFAAATAAATRLRETMTALTPAT